MKKEIIDYINELYPNNSQEVIEKIKLLIKKNKQVKTYDFIDEKDVMLITYGDSILSKNKMPLKALNTFLDEYTRGLIKNVHLLPMFPYSSDDGFSVIDYLKINPSLGSWEDIKDLAERYYLMFDGVINHISVKSDWFNKYLNQDDKYKNYFIQCDPNLDYSLVVRPRALPLYYPYQTRKGIKYVWATFSDDQVDLNYKNPDVLLDVLNILVEYIKNGARFIRLDAIGFLWKEAGTSSIHLRQTHLLVKIMRYVVDQVLKGTILISETNVPHNENITYFGTKDDEAQMVYQFPLPPLTLFSFLTGNALKLSTWAKSLNDTPLHPFNTYFNFLASHDGIGVRPAEDILDAKEKQIMIDHVINSGGKVSYKLNPDGSKSPYELNISYFDAINQKDDSIFNKVNKFIASQVVLLSVIGMPGIYIHSLLGSQNDYEGLKTSNIFRRINREKLDYQTLTEELNDKNHLRYQVFNKYMELLSLRKKQKAFSPKAEQEVLFLDKRVFAIIRNNKQAEEKVLVIVNVSKQELSLKTEFLGYDIINNEKIKQVITMKKYQYRWIVLT